MVPCKRNLWWWFTILRFFHVKWSFSKGSPDSSTIQDCPQHVFLKTSGSSWGEKINTQAPNLFLFSIEWNEMNDSSSLVNKTSHSIGKPSLELKKDPPMRKNHFSFSSGRSSCSSAVEQTPREPKNCKVMGSIPAGWWAFFLFSLSLCCALNQVSQGGATLLILFFRYKIDSALLRANFGWKVFNRTKLNRTFLAKISGSRNQRKIIIFVRFDVIFLFWS